MLQNASEIGWGYDKPGTPLKNISSPKRTWHFVGNNVHDFVWAADPDYEHIVRKQDGVILNVIYKKVDSLQKELANCCRCCRYCVALYGKTFWKISLSSNIPLYKVAMAVWNIRWPPY